MAEKHASDLRDYQKKLLGKEIRPKFSRDLLNLRKIQDTLGIVIQFALYSQTVSYSLTLVVAKQKDYAEAHKIKLKADALEAWELEKWHSVRQQDLIAKEAKFKTSKQQELIALQKRIQTGREEQKKQRHQDLERLLQRYQNVKAELEAQQNLERIRMEKLVQSGIFY